MSWSSYLYPDLYLTSPQFLFNNLVQAPPFLPMPEEVLSMGHLDEEQEALLAGSLNVTAALPADLGQSGFDVVPEGTKSATTPHQDSCC